MKGPTLLKAWLAKQDLSDEQFAKTIGTHRTQIYRAAKGKRRPGLDLAVVIERATGGAVPVDSWADVPVARSRHSRKFPRTA